jgi:hypothetical protein
MTFNEVLKSPEGRQRLNTTQADLLLGDFAQHNVTIMTRAELFEFADQHPELFHVITEEERRNGHQTLSEMWDEYRYIPLRRLNGRFFRESAGTRPW